MWPVKPPEGLREGANLRVHYHKFVMVPKTSFFDEEKKVQRWIEKCRCGCTCAVHMAFDRSGSRITPLAKKHWFDAYAGYQKATGELNLAPEA